jgi:hypothetical protein
MKNKIKNLKEFNELRKRYETITLEDIKLICKKFKFSYYCDVRSYLTGFGDRSTCTLCKPMDNIYNNNNCGAC